MADQLDEGFVGDENRDDPNLDNPDSNDTLSAEEESEARDMGWVPLDEFHGDKTKWVGAKDYLDRGRNVMPILRSQRDSLKGELQAERTARTDLERRLRLAEAAVGRIQDSQQEDAAADVQAAIADVRGKIAKASRDGDHEAVADLTERLVDLKATATQVKAPPPRKDNGGTLQRYIPGETWLSNNSWADSNSADFDVDRYYAAMATGVKLQKAQPSLRDEAFYNALDQQLARQSRNARGRQPSKVEGSRMGGGGGGGDGTYDALPADAKRECDNQARNPKLVGPTKQYKTVAEYRQYYATEYFRQ